MLNRRVEHGSRHLSKPTELPRSACPRRPLHSWETDLRRPGCDQGHAALEPFDFNKNYATPPALAISALRYTHLMKMPRIVALLALGVASCSNEPTATKSVAPPPQRAKPALPAARIPYSLAGGHTKADRYWRMVVVKAPLTDSDLIALAKDLHTTYSEESICIFDDASKIKAYEDWDENYPNDAYPFPKQWVRKHHIGTVNRMLSPGGSTWQLLGGAAHATRPESMITELQ